MTKKDINQKVKFKKTHKIKNVLPEIKYELSWKIKLILVLSFPIWILPFLITNLVFGGLMRNLSQNFPRNGTIKVPKGQKIKLNSLEFYNYDMEIKNAPQLKIDAEEWNRMNPQDIVVTTADNLELHTFIFVNPKPNHKWIIATHGWAQNRYSILYLVKHFYNQGYHVVTYDSRGHGSNKIVSITYGDKEANDLLLIIKYTSEFSKQNDPEFRPNISLIGNSMGATTILEACCRYDLIDLGVKSVIFDCGYDKCSNTMKYIGKRFFKMHWFWFYFGAKKIFKWRNKFEFKNINPLAKIDECETMPVLFIIGTKDEAIPVTMVQRLYQEKLKYELVSKSSEILIVQDAGHVRSIMQDYDLYTKNTLDFVEKWTKI